MRICIVGSGVVGKATGQGLGRQGHNVVFYDTSLERRNLLESEGLPTASTLSEAGERDVYFVCVPTPLSDEGFNLDYVRAAASAVADTFTAQNCPVVAVRSTMLPGTMRNVVLPVLRKKDAVLGRDFGLCYNPEFLRAATALEDLLHPPLTVVGEMDTRSADVVAELHRPFGAEILRTTPENAEAIKCFSNAFNATKISFFNMLSLVCERSGLDSGVVSRSIVSAATASRFADYGTPGGRPYGGACLPKDTAACVRFMEALGVDSSLLRDVEQMNADIADCIRVGALNAS